VQHSPASISCQMMTCLTSFLKLPILLLFNHICPNVLIVSVPLLLFKFHVTFLLLLMMIFTSFSLSFVMITDIKSLEFGSNNKDIIAMFSSEGERVTLGKNLRARNLVEGWLKDVEGAMMRELQRFHKLSVEEYGISDLPHSLPIILIDCLFDFFHTYDSCDIHFLGKSSHSLAFRRRNVKIGFLTMLRK
jgi:hypothetical protein